MEVLFFLVAIQSVSSDERGVSTTQYVLVAALIAIVAMAVAVILGGALNERLGGP